MEGFIFIFLALTGMRQWLVKLIPATLKTATGVGIGFLLTEIGLSYSAGIGAITGGGRSSPLTLGGCPAELIDPDSGMCTSGEMSNPKVSHPRTLYSRKTDFLALAGRLLRWHSDCLSDGVPSQVCPRHRHHLGIRHLLAVSIPSTLATQITINTRSRNTAVTYFPDTDEGNSRFEFFKQVVAWHPLSKVANQLEWNIQTSGTNFALALFTFLYVDIIDATATLYSMVRFCGVVNPKDGDFPRSTIAYCTDAAFISVAALFGSSPVTAFIESGAGIAEGGRTGLTAIVTGLCFVVAVFFAPIFASIPPWATGCTLVLVSNNRPSLYFSSNSNSRQVGCMMIRQITQINWRYIGDVLPSFVVMTFIPFSYSVAYGLIA